MVGSIMENLKLIITDMDGTLLTSNSTISDVTLNTLIKAQEAGIKLVLASGRSWKTLTRYGQQLQMDKYHGWFIGVNGAAITDVSTMANTVLAQLNPEQIQEIFDATKDLGVEVMGVCDATIYDYIPDSVLELKKIYRQENNIADDVPMTGGAFKLVVDQRPNYPDIYFINGPKDIPGNINKICFCHYEEKITEITELLTETLGDKYSFVRTTPTWLECMPLNISKGNAITTLQEKLNISKEETIIFGDGENDLSMFDCGTAVAMGNAMDLVKEQADEITLDNNSDGIAEVIKKYL